MGNVEIWESWLIMGDMHKWLDAYLVLNDHITNRDRQKRHFEAKNQTLRIKNKFSNLRTNLKL